MSREPELKINKRILFLGALLCLSCAHPVPPNAARLDRPDVVLHVTASTAIPSLVTNDDGTIFFAPPPFSTYARTAVAVLGLTEKEAGGVPLSAAGDGRDAWLLRVATSRMGVQPKRIFSFLKKSHVPWVALEIGSAETVSVPSDAPREITQQYVKKTVGIIRAVRDAGYVCYHVWGQGECGDEGTRGSGRDCLWRTGMGWKPVMEMTTPEYVENIEMREGKVQVLCSLQRTNQGADA